MEKRVGVLRGVFNTLMRLFRSLLRKLKDLERKAGVECGRFGQAGEVIFISCDDIGFPDTEVTELLNGFKADREHALLNGFGLGNEEQAQRVYDGTLRNFTRIKREGNFEKMYMENGQMWTDFCNDACLHFMARSVLHGKGIPFVRKQTIQETPMQERNPI